MMRYRPPKGTAGLALSAVNGCRREPIPPARMMLIVLSCMKAIAHLLRTAHGSRAPDALRDLGLASLHEYCMQTLTIRVRMPVREKDNWSIPAPRGCPCRLCGRLALFLCASDQVRFEWPLAKNQRAHIHQILDAHVLPVSHTTRRAGRPFTLILMKTEALFEREATE